ncbi:MAG: threonine aldolase [Bacteroidetes bacterium HGW-Bacteroidetes-6]|jgi:threonine aldolase|nr:MAG: threonine aldolase [Bacteroidetes bacterium HGW-Bacteroidetes-6]
MFSFKNDYSEGCHPRILEALSKANTDQQEGYGDDEYSNEARKLIMQQIQNTDAKIRFVSGGTQANAVVIAAALRPHESVISAESGHINIHEAGAIEATGHKIEFASTTDGKLSPALIEPLLVKAEDHHMVKPKLVYISNSTELGTVYRKAELETLSAFCRQNNLYLFCDGARLGAALTSPANDLTLADMASLCDVFYIGGTKNGALMGEAIVIMNDALKTDFEFHLKQRGALISKGRLIGIQFAEMFRDELFFEMAQHANKMAMKIAAALQQKGFRFVAEPESNQIFPILPNELIAKLEKHYGFYHWKKVDNNHTSIRLVTSWATDEKAVDEFVNML